MEPRSLAEGANFVHGNTNFLHGRALQFSVALRKQAGPFWKLYGHESRVTEAKGLFTLGDFPKEALGFAASKVSGVGIPVPQH